MLLRHAHSLHKYLRVSDVLTLVTHDGILNLILKKKRNNNRIISVYTCSTNRETKDGQDRATGSSINTTKSSISDANKPYKTTQVDVLVDLISNKISTFKLQVALSLKRVRIHLKFEINVRASNRPDGVWLTTHLSITRLHGFRGNSSVLDLVLTPWGH